MIGRSTIRSAAVPQNQPPEPAHEPAGVPRNMDKALGDGGMALLGQLGVNFDAYGVGWASAVWEPTELACNPLGGVHGGVFGVIHDAAMNFATSSALESGDRAATLDVTYQIMRPAEAGHALAVRGEIVRVTKQVAYAESTVRDADGEIVSRGSATFLLRRRQPR
jgi:uncharacterized protein (TIGR00369 family)